MSQLDTYVPGMNDTEYQNNSGDLYSRNSGNSVNPSFTPNGTFVPGVSEDVAPEPAVRKKGQDGEPVVGFLYSISRKGIGEFWPLHLGANTIGRATSCDIQLKEQSISEKHATISVKQMKSTQTMIASVQDTGSKNGIYLNDEELDYESHTCKNGDVLTIGSCYQLLLLLINAKEYGLSVCPDFKPIVEKTEMSEEPTMPVDKMPDMTHHYVDQGTIDMFGRNSFPGPGETKIM